MTIDDIEGAMQAVSRDPLAHKQLEPIAMPETVRIMFGDDAVYCTSDDHIGGPVWHHKDFHAPEGEE